MDTDPDPPHLCRSDRIRYTTQHFIKHEGEKSCWNKPTVFWNCHDGKQTTTATTSTFRVTRMKNSVDKSRCTVPWRKEEFFRAGTRPEQETVRPGCVQFCTDVTHTIPSGELAQNPSITSLHKQQHTNTQAVPYSTQHNSRGGPNLGTPSGTDCTCEHRTGGAGCCTDRDPRPHYRGQCPRKDWRLAWAASRHSTKLLCCCCCGCLVLYQSESVQGQENFVHKTKSVLFCS
jgi:hypothetical protein